MTEKLTLTGLVLSFYAAMGAQSPYLPLYLKQLRLTAKETGVIFGIRPIINFLASPVFGFIADKTRRPQCVSSISIFISGVALLVFVLLPSLPSFALLSSPTTSKAAPDKCRVESEAILIAHTDVLIEVCAGGAEKQLHFREVPCPKKKEQHANFLTRCALDVSQHALAYLQEGKSLQERKKVVDNSAKPSNDQAIESSGNVSVHETCLELSNCQGSMPVHRQGQQTDGAYAQFSNMFLIAITLCIIIDVFTRPITQLLDTMILQSLEDVASYGKIRGRGTIAYGASAFATSVIITFICGSTSSIADFYIMCAIYSLFSVSFITLSFCMKTTDAKINTVMATNTIFTVLQKPSVLGFLSLVCFLGIVHSAADVFLFWYLDDIGASKLLIGLCVAVECTFEAIIMHFSGRIINRIGSSMCLCLTFLSYSIRLFLYSCLPGSVWFALLIELLHGLTYGLTYPTLTTYGAIVAPHNMVATFQGLIGGLYYGLGVAMGNFITGILFDPESGVGTVRTFQIYGVASTVLLLVNIGFMALTRKSKDTGVCVNEDTIELHPLMTEKEE